MPNSLNESIAKLDIPDRMKSLPISPTGYPTPWFVAWMKDGQPSPRGIGDPDFRVIFPGAIADAAKRDVCWLCGIKLGAYKAFCLGPMCAVTRTTSEPPCHLDCATFAAIACPFLSKPRMKRNEVDLPEGHSEQPGYVIKRNPGCACVWVTKDYKFFKANPGVLIRVGAPTQVLWFAEGRPAMREEVMKSIDSGYPILEDMALKDGAGALFALGQKLEVARRLMPMV